MRKVIDLKTETRTVVDENGKFLKFYNFPSPSGVVVVKRDGKDLVTICEVTPPVPPQQVTTVTNYLSDDTAFLSTYY